MYFSISERIVHKTGFNSKTLIRIKNATPISHTQIKIVEIQKYLSDIMLQYSPLKALLSMM